MNASALTGHTIAQIVFKKGLVGEDTPMTCSCSWTGMAGDFQAHRKKVGAPRRDVQSLGPRAKVNPLRVKLL